MSSCRSRLIQTCRIQVCLRHSSSEVCSVCPGNNGSHEWALNPYLEITFRSLGGPDPFSGSVSGNSSFMNITRLWSEDGAAPHSPSWDKILGAHTEPQTCENWEQNAFLIFWEREHSICSGSAFVFCFSCSCCCHHGAIQDTALEGRLPPSLLSSSHSQQPFLDQVSKNT